MDKKEPKKMDNEQHSNLYSWFSSAISSWQNLIRSIIFLICCAVGIAFIVEKTINGLKANNLKITTSTGSTIEVGQNTKLQTFIVHPRGWNKTGLYLNKGDKLNISATGSVNLAMGRMMEALEYQYKIKKKNEDKTGINSREIKYFTKEEKLKSAFVYPWNGPEGIDYEEIYDNSAKKRVKDSEKDRVVSSAKVGQLIAFISPSNITFPDFSSSQVIPFSTSNTIVEVNKEGYLWFIINDLKLSGDKIGDKLIWQDNLGFFNILMAVNSKN